MKPNWERHRRSATRRLSPCAFAAAASAAFAGAAPAQTAGAPALAEVVVTASRIEEDPRRTLSDVIVIDRPTIERSVGASLIDVLHAAGVEIAQAGGRGTLTGVFLRGTKTAQSVVLIDGMRIENPTSGGANLEFMPTTAIERIEIVRGPASPLYGSGAIGGVIHIFTRRLDGPPRAYGSATIGSMDTRELSAGYGGRSGDTRFNLLLGHERTAGFDATNPASPHFQPDRDGNRQTSANLSVAHRLSAQWEIALTTLVNRGRAEYDDAFTTPQQAVIDYATRASTLSLRGNPTQRWHTQLRLGRTDIDYEFRAFAFAPKTSTTGLSWFNTVDAWGGRASFGLEREVQRIGGEGLTSGPFPYAQDRRAIDSVLGGWDREFGDHQLKAQLRHDRIEDVGSANTGSLAYGYRFAPQWRLRAAVASAFRAPTFDDLYNPFGSNPALRPERARGAEAGIDWRPGGALYRVTLFAHRIRDAIELDSAFVPTNLNRARNRGVAFDARQPLGALTLRGHLTLQRAEGERIDPVTGAHDTTRLARRAGRIAVIGADYAHGPWTLWTELVAQGRRFDTANEPMAGYGVVNLGAQYRVSREVALFARIANAGDRRYETVAGYNAAPRAGFVGVRYDPR
ncbi:MAG TPA: TonB-dependent receptor [Burkholderiaceae bacterium]|nr:TonB-dependent receptor [Burkholderiaceae bacterium]